MQLAPQLWSQSLLPALLLLLLLHLHLHPLQLSSPLRPTPPAQPASSRLPSPARLSQLEFLPSSPSNLSSSPRPLTQPDPLALSQSLSRGLHPLLHLPQPSSQLSAVQDPQLASSPSLFLV